jgi:hypothetical protein
MNPTLSSVLMAVTCLWSALSWGQEPPGDLPQAPPPIEEMPAAQAQTSQPEHRPTLENFREALQPYGQWVNTPE